jgi:hypothetical protein
MLLCHGRRHDRYSRYYRRALHIDGSRRAKPDIVHDLNNGLPKLNKKFNLIQSVYWPQLHRIGLDFKGMSMIRKNTPQIRFLCGGRIVACDGYSTFNCKLLKSISEQLEDGGFFVFHHSGNNQMLETLLQHFGLKKVTVDVVEKQCGLTLEPNMTKHYPCYFQKVCVSQ